MRTTLDLDRDVLNAAKEIALARGMTTGQVVSELVRKALTGGQRSGIRNGVPLISQPANAPLLTMAEVNRLRD